MLLTRELGLSNTLSDKLRIGYSDSFKDLKGHNPIWPLGRIGVPSPITFRLRLLDQLGHFELLIPIWLAGQFRIP